MPILYTSQEELDKWDKRFISLAEHVAAWSKGPRTRVGAVVVRPDKSIASMGYNGAPRGFDDEAFLRMERSEQHKHVIHAEHNAIEQACKGESLVDCTLYVWPLLPCKECAKRIVAAGIKRVVAYCGYMSPDWEESAKQGEAIFLKHGVYCTFAFEDF